MASNEHVSVNTPNPWDPSTLPLGILRLQILDYELNNIPVKKPYFVITLGDQTQQTPVGETSPTTQATFELVVDFHAQLFGTLQLDLYDSNKWLSDRHIGRTEFRISLLETMPACFTNYYEIWEKQLSSGASSSVGQEMACKNNLGVLQLRLAYLYQTAAATVATSTTVTATPEAAAGQMLLTETEDQLPRRLSDLLIPGIIHHHNPCNNYDGGDDDGDEYGDYQSGGTGYEHNDDSCGGTIQGPPGATNLVEKEAMDADLKRYARYQRQRNKLLDTDGEYRSILNEGGSDDDEEEDVHSSGPKQQPGLIPSDRKPIRGPSNTSLSDRAALDQQQETNVDQDNGKDNRQVLRAIGKLLSQFGQGLELSNLQILSGFNLLEKYYAQLPRSQDRDIVLDLKQVELMGHFWKFALASYGWKGLNFLGRGNGVFSDGWRDNSDALSIVEYLSIPKADLLAYEFRSAEAFRPSYFIAWDRSTDAIVLSIRGTMSVSDTLTDLVCTYEPWRGGIVHSGMKESAMWFLRNVAPQLLVYCQQYSVSNLYIIGHSLGSATASILTMLLMDYFDEFKEKCGDAFNMECFGYAPACCLDLNLAESYKDRIHSFVSADDIVSKLSYGSMMTLKDMIIAGVEATKLVGPKSSESDRYQLAFDRINKVRDRCLKSKENPRLYVAGQIYQFWLDPVEDHDTRVVIEKTNARQVCGEVIVQRSVIGDHLPSNFDLVVKRCRETLMRRNGQNRQQQQQQGTTTPLSTDDLWHQFSALKCDSEGSSKEKNEGP